MSACEGAWEAGRGRCRCAAEGVVEEGLGDVYVGGDEVALPKPSRLDWVARDTAGVCRREWDRGGEDGDWLARSVSLRVVENVVRV